MPNTAVFLPAIHAPARESRALNSAAVASTVGRRPGYGSGILTMDAASHIETSGFWNSESPTAWPELADTCLWRITEPSTLPSPYEAQKLGWCAVLVRRR